MPAGNTPPSSVNSVGALAPFVTELDRLAPSFDVRGEQIQIIRTPAEFYETLKVRLPSIRKRQG
jgi:CDP-diacylglycerol---glycerol-3-phosphate 3-phosphatidyltransferase